MTMRCVNSRSRMSSRKTLAALVVIGLHAFALAPQASAQSDDFGMDFSFEAGKKIRKGLDFSIEGNARTQDNTRKMERWSVGGALGMKLYNTKKFDVKASLKWEYMWKNNLSETKDKYDEEVYNTPEGEYTETYYKGYNCTEHYWRNRHRTSAALSATYSPNKRWAFSLKETFQYNHFCQTTKTTEKYRLKDEDDMSSMYLKEMELKDVKAKDRTVLRSKATALYNTKKCPIDPYLSCEFGCGLNYVASKWKLETGADYKLNKKNKLNMFYRYQTENDDEEPNGHLIGIGYSIKF